MKSVFALRLFPQIPPGPTNDAAFSAGDILNASMGPRAKVIHSDPNILGGTPVFVGTRVPLQNLIDCLEAGDSLDDFLKSFPSVTRQQAVAALELSRESLEASAHTTR